MTRVSSLLSKFGKSRMGNRQQRGISMIELLVAMAIGLFLMGGIISVFIGTKKSFSTQSGMSQLQQSARFAMDILSAEFRMAGFMGCVSNTTDFFNALNVLPNEVDLGIPVQGFEATGASTWTPALPAAISANVFGGTDVVILRRAEDGGHRLVTEMPSPSGAVFVQAGLNPPPYDDGDILLISDCTRSAIFQTNNYQPASGTVVRNTGVGTPGNSTFDLSADGSAFNTDATVFKIESRTFFIAESAGENSAGDKYQSLWVRNEFDNPIELVPGIEDLQILYGEDTDADGVHDRFVTANQVTDFAAVLSAKIRIVANSVDPVGETGDRILRQPFETSVQLRNRGL